MANAYTKNTNYCPCCRRPFQPQPLRNGKMSQTCGNTACVVSFRQKQYSGNKFSMNSPRLRWQGN